MTYFLGLVGVLQIMLIPGLLLYRLLNDVQHKNFWMNLPLILSLSFIFNYFMVVGLTTFHYYIPHVLRSIVGAELVLLILSYPRFWNLPMTTARYNFQLFGRKNKQSNQYTKIYFAVFFLVLLLFIGLWINSWGQVFGIRDPAVSYNPWAIEWSNNQFPTYTWHYPQLLTTNWSIAYVMMGTLPLHVVLEMFPASLNLVFPILFVIIFLDLFRKEHNRGYLLSGILLSLFMASAWTYISHGHMDWVCAFLNLLSLKLIYELSVHPQKKIPWRSYIQIILVISAAALSKPAGITTLVLAPLLFATLVRFDTVKRPEILLLYSYVLLALLVLPWYIYAEYHETLSSNHGADLLFLIWGIFRLTSWPSYISQALAVGWIPLVFLLATFFFSKSLPRFWRFVFYFYSPYFFIWAFLYSYDSRNLDILLPILTTCVGLIISHHDIDISFTNYLTTKFHKVSQLNKLWILLILLLLFAGREFLAEPWYRGHLINHEIDTKNHIYDIRPGIIKLEAYANCPGFDGKIIGSMLLFDQLPILASHIVPAPQSYFGSNMLPQTFSNLSLLQQMLNEHPDVRYFLFDMRFFDLVTSQDSRKVIKSWIDTKKITPVLDDTEIVLYRINVPLSELNFTVPNSQKVVK